MKEGSLHAHMGARSTGSSPRRRDVHGGSDVATDLSRAPVEQVLAALGVDGQVGLSDAEVQARLARYGLNEVPERKPHPLRELAKKFWGLSAWMLELIMMLSWVLGKYSDLVIVSCRDLLAGHQ